MSSEQIETIIKNENLEDLDIKTINELAYNKDILNNFTTKVNKPYSKIISVLIHKKLEESQAKVTWTEIVTHMKSLEKTLKRPVGINVASVDYIENIKNSSEDMRIILENELESISKIATIDDLTSLYKREVLDVFIKKIYEKAKRKNSCFSFVMIDIDDFKNVNDTYGHQKGDEVLNKISTIIKKSIRQMDIAFRYGGEELCVIFPDTKKQDAVNIAEKIRENVQKEYQNDMEITISLGVSDNTDSSKNEKEIIEIADKFLYEAKNSGKNIVKF
ncbi:GGDEF domain-containing protein [Arcobacter sp. YIC-464]|uniref:GGDEF domain-containing protein n=1 Tax=Arcobacter sp. YIC-464 TaxID=3376631 RepID=UPI003C16F008